MTTVPDLPFEGHLQNLIDRLCHHVPAIGEMSLCFYDTHDAKRIEEGWVLPTAGLKDLTAMAQLFEHLCKEGRAWIHLSGAGKTRHGMYLIPVDYSQSKGNAQTSINFAGPSLDREGRIKDLADIQII